MDIYCPRCAEPWDAASLHEAYDDDQGEPIPYIEAARLFRSIGCGVMTGCKITCAIDPDSTLALMAKTVMDLSDSPDDWCSDMEDLRYLEGI